MAEKEKAMKATRDGYGDGLIDIGSRNKNVVCLDADLAKSTRSIQFGKKFPDRFKYIGISEADLVATAAGLAFSGKIAYASTFAEFLTARAYDQIRMSVCYSNANVKLVGSHGGLLTGSDGPSAQAILDLSLMRTMPNMKVVFPADAVEVRKATVLIGEIDGPCYMRTCREKTPVFFDESHSIKLGKAKMMREGKDVTLFSTGPILAESLEAAEMLKKEKVDAAVVHVPWLKPFDEKTIVDYAKKTGRVVSIEDHTIIGALGSAIAETLSEHYPTPLRRVGVRDMFGESGCPKDLYKKYGLDADAISKKALELMKEVRK
jgi:transketolase